MPFEIRIHTQDSILLCSSSPSDHGLVEKKRLANILNLRYGAFQIEGLGKYYFEYLRGNIIRLITGLIII